MAHHKNNHNRRSLGASTDPQISKPIMDLTGKRHPKSTTAATTSAVYNLTNHFTRLNPNNTKPTTTKTQNPQPQPKVIDTHLQVKALAKSVNLEPRVGKQGKRVVFESDKKSLVVVENRKDSVLTVSGGGGTTIKAKKVEKGNEIIKPTSITTTMGKRRSFCDVQVELANFLLTNCAKVVSADMPPLVKIHAVGFARKTKDSLEKFTSKSLALSLKKEFDGVYGPAWHCIVGTSFGSFVTHSVGGFLYFSLDQKMYILLFKTSVQRAE